MRFKMGKPIMKKEYEFLMDLLDKFTNNCTFSKKLNVIDEQGISGWENWLQIEFSYYLSESADDVEWYRELRCLPDKRYVDMKDRYNIIPDFVVRKKGWLKNYFLFIEFKQNVLPSTCIRNMFSDLQKILSMKKDKEFNVRSYWCVGFTKTIDIDELKSRIIMYNSEYYDIEKYLTIKRIGRTPFTMIVF